MSSITVTNDISLINIGEAASDQKKSILFVIQQRWHSASQTSLMWVTRKINVDVFSFKWCIWEYCRLIYLRWSRWVIALLYKPNRMYCVWNDTFTFEYKHGFKLNLVHVVNVYLRRRIGFVRLDILLITLSCISFVYGILSVLVCPKQGYQVQHLHKETR